MLDISVIILTFNEELHIRRCLQNAFKFAKCVYVVDSFSTDKTVEIARSLGAFVYQNPWTNHSVQFNWALSNLPIKTEWVFKMDADEYLSDELIEELNVRIPKIEENVNGITFPCLRIFMGKYIKHGILPIELLRLFKFKFGASETRNMDEHIYISAGEVCDFKNPFFDDNLNGLTWWINKHNGYSTREAMDLLITEYALDEQYTREERRMGKHSEAVRKAKLAYLKLPLFWRPFFYFLYRYMIRMGFLDGIEGFLWHFMQGWWYRTLADAKVYEIKKGFKYDNEKIVEFLKEIISKK
jgi:glycosyltransferase involved in cell wall biosynthesis